MRLIYPTDVALRMAPPPLAPSYPNTAYLVSLLGGVFLVLGGLTDLATGALLRSAGLEVVGLGTGGKILLLGLGVVGLAVGLIVVYGALQIRNRPETAHTWGVLIVAFSLVSLVGSSGFLVGLVLGLIGGILALRWQPPVPIVGNGSTFRRGPPWTPAVSLAPPPSATASRVCPACGSAAVPAASRCPNCGTGLPGP